MPERRSPAVTPAAAAFEAASDACVAEAVEAIAAGEMVVLVGSWGRKNVGGLAMAAERVTPEAIEFMDGTGRGVICTPMLVEDLERLHISPLTIPQMGSVGTALHVPVDHASCSTGLTEADRARTIRALADPASTPKDFRHPGHVFPMGCRPGGVLERTGHTEATIELCSAAGLAPAGVICMIARDDDELDALPALLRFSTEHDLRMITTDDLVAYRNRAGRPVRREAESLMPLPGGTFRAVGYTDAVGGDEHLALVLGDISDGRGVLVNVHAECVMGAVFASRRCACRAELERALETIADEGRGVLVYLRDHDDRGSALMQKLRSEAVRPHATDDRSAHHRADGRDVWVAAAILRDLGVTSMRLLTNDVAAVATLESCGLLVAEWLPLSTAG